MKHLFALLLLASSLTVFGEECARSEENKLSTYLSPKWGQCVAGPYRVTIWVQAGVKNTIDDCFDQSELIQTDDMAEAKQVFAKNNKAKGFYGKFKKFYDDMDAPMDSYCGKKFPKLPVLLENYATMVWGVGESGNEVICQIKYPSL